MEEHTPCAGTVRRGAPAAGSSNDPFFVDDVELLQKPIQALERHQPVLPMGLGHAQGVSHGYVRHGTTTLFAALDIATGEVTAQCKQRHRHQDYLAFLRHIDKNVPEDLDIHLVVDNYATHKHAKVRAWLARRPRYHVHYTPTYASWLNQVERWFGIITQQAIRRGSFSSVPQLRRRINEFVDNYNKNCRPFAWTATADSILAKVERIGLFISGRHTSESSRCFQTTRCRPGRKGGRDRSTGAWTLRHRRARGPGGPRR